MTEQTKWGLKSNEYLPIWLNLAFLVKDEFPLPVIGEKSEPATVEILSKIYSEECAKIEMLDGKYREKLVIPIPGKIMDEYRKYRPTPLFRARGLEKAVGYEGRIYFKREDVNPTGSHKPNTAIPQAFYAKDQGLNGLITDTGAGQWGTALALAAKYYNLNCTIFMTRNSYFDKPYRRYLMELVDAKVLPSPSELTDHGKILLKENPDHWGSLGIGMGEAMEMVKKRPDNRLALGCMSYYAALHQTIVGEELKVQLEKASCRPDILIACVGGGTNLFGFMSPFIKNRIENTDAPEMIAAESDNVPVLTKGEYRYDYADAFKLTPKVLMYTLGHDSVPPKMHSGGLRYHGKSPILSLMVKKGFINSVAIPQKEAFDAGRLFFISEGILPAPESAHAIASSIREVNRAKQEGRKKDIVFCLSGTGYLDLLGYARMFNLETGK
jgi:tryptophan synthase beta chain